ncbi:MAG TPA: hypothetical protein VFZ70_16810 [Euzebyales bacterium]
MNVLQVWLLIGVPVLFVALALFTARSPVVGSLGVLVALGGAVAVSIVDRASGAALGVIAVLMYAAGSAGRGAATGDDPVRRHDADGASPT